MVSNDIWIVYQQVIHGDECRGFREDAIEEPDQDEDEESGGKGKKSADADLINIAQEKMMAEEASKCQYWIYNA